MSIVQKKKVILLKGSRTIVTALCLMFVAAAAGCGKVEEPIPVQLSSGNVEELQNSSIRENEYSTDENEEGNSGNDTSEKADQGDSSDENNQQTKDEQPQSIGNAELDGNVQSIGADSFVVDRAETWSEGDSQYMVSAASGYEKEEDLITVYVNQDCVWEFKTVKNGGINPEDVSTGEGSFADLQEGIVVSIKGSWQDDGSFLADSIVMMQFV